MKLEIGQEVYFFDAVRFKLRIGVYEGKYHGRFILRNDDGYQTILPEYRIYLSKLEFLKSVT